MSGVRRVLLSGAVAVWLGLVVGPGLAFTPDEPLSDPVLEARARALHEGLRCMVCQGQSIGDSDAALARDMRAIVRERIAAGESDADVRGFLTDRYGDYVLLDPPVKPETYALWFGPAAVFVAGAAIAFALLRRARASASGAGAAPLSAEERRRLDALLDDDT
ncbi:MAG: cytochrome c-type biogenesis protein CcmH [Alphaproteobacteria bacterium]|nr:cytochrome c-type biogenesis protein CcmH [Alphaproteobacteria bacterium]